VGDRLAPHVCRSPDLSRLQFTQIETNIHDHGVGEWRSISFITDARVVKEDSTGRLLSVELEMGDWLVY